MKKNILMQLFAAVVAVAMTLPVAAESFMQLDHNPYGYTIVRENYHDIVLDRYGNISLKIPCPAAVQFTASTMNV